MIRLCSLCGKAYVITHDCGPPASDRSKSVPPSMWEGNAFVERSKSAPPLAMTIENGAAPVLPVEHPDPYHLEASEVPICLNGYCVFCGRGMPNAALINVAQHVTAKHFSHWKIDDREQYFRRVRETHLHLKSLGAV